MVDLNEFNKEIDCTYENECYSVRDNGAILRNPIDKKKQRPTDNKWTFGKLNEKTGYLEIASVRIHRIVATAIHGEPPSKEYVVDHIDTNRQNNRPDNLRWVTRLENVLLNPITIKRIETACGFNVEEFLTDPSKFRNKFQEPKYKWMCNVSIEEAQASKERLLAWAASDKFPSGGFLGRWIYNPSLLKKDIENKEDFVSSLTLYAVQKNWKTASEFPCCPQTISINPITDYTANLQTEKVFAQNQYSKSIIETFAISKDENKLWVMCRCNNNNAIKPYSLAEVTIENNSFVHNNLGSFFEKKGAEKQITLAQGLEWDGGDTFDDFN
jgi:hypothetical protein